MKPGSYFECLNNNCDKQFHCFLVDRGLAGLRKTTKRQKKKKKLRKWILKVKKRHLVEITKLIPWMK